MPYFSLIENRPATESEASDESSLIDMASAWTRPPNWEELLYGSREPECDPISTPFNPTYFEDCKLAEDCALNFVAKLELPVFNSLRDVNQQRVTRALKSLRKGHFGLKNFTGKQEILAHVMMMDFVSCCCQEGNLLTLYEKCKMERIIKHLNMIDGDLGLAVKYWKGCTLDQVKCAESLVIKSLKRIPKSVKFTSYSLKDSFKKKISVLKKEEKNLKENSVFHFNDEICSPIKKQRKLSASPSPAKKVSSPSVQATSMRWIERPVADEESSTSSLSPRKNQFNGFITTPLSEHTPLKDCAGLSQKTSTPKSSKPPHFLKELFMSDNEQTAKHTQSTLKSLPSQELSSNYLKVVPTSNFSGYCSDDSLPDIPIDLATYCKKRKQTPKTGTFVNKTEEGSVSNVTLSQPVIGFQATHSVHNLKKQAPFAQKTKSPKLPISQVSPYKTKLNSWNASYNALKPVNSVKIVSPRHGQSKLQQANDDRPLLLPKKMKQTELGKFWMRKV